MTSGLPQPATNRWQPLRAGLVDLFYYDQQEFRFRDGRLLLRGNNGTGKSKVLALLLPFLLDGDLSPYRVEPDADGRKRMEWNLLLGGAHPNPERIGYSWLEFGRIDDDGVPRFCTIGCGMKAVRGRGIAAHWYLVSSGRVGAELRLVDGQGYPLSRDRLADALAGHGERYDTAASYRRAVDATLFGLGHARYSALVDLLIQLRQPQLSKKPSEKVLSQALTESLPPLDQAILADVAEAFRSLQDDRDELADMRAALAGTGTFLDHYRRYARTASRRKATALRQAHSRYEKVSSELTNARAAVTETVEREAALRTGLELAEDTQLRLEAERRALEDSETAGAAKDLEQARHAAAAAERLAAERARDHDDAQRHATGQQQRLIDADAELTTATARLTTARVHAATQAGLASLPAAHESGINAPADELITGTGPSTVPELRRTADRITTAHIAAIKRVRALIEQAVTAQERAAVAQDRVDELDTRSAELAEESAAAQARVEAAAADHTRAVGDYLRGTTELVLDDLVAVLDELAAWALMPVGDSPAVTAITTRGAVVTDELTRADATAEAEQRLATARLAELRTERRRLSEGGIERPPVPYTRDPGSRTDRPGAALWQVIDFAPTVPDTEKAGLEAALEAAGVLDAWVTPSGELHSAAGEVVVSGDTPAAGATLESVLVAAIDDADPYAATLTPAAVTAVLAAIGLGAVGGHHSWVDSTGRFRLGVLDGAWTKPAAAYIGAGAREQERRRRIAELDALIETVTSELDAVAESRRRLAQRRGAVRTEIAGLPADTDLRAAHQQVALSAGAQRRVAADRLEAVEGAVRAAAAAAAAAAERDRDAADAGLPAQASALDTITDALTDYRLALADLWSAIDTVLGARRHRGHAATDAAAATERLARTSDAAESARRDALAIGQRYETLNASVGAEVAHLRAELGRVGAAVAENKTLRTRLQREVEAAVLARGTAEGRAAELASTLDVERGDRDNAAAALRRFADTGLFGVALTSTEVPAPGPWSAAAAVAFARAVDAELADVAEDDKTLDRTQQRVTEEHKNLADLLSAQGNSTSMSLREEGIVVEVVFRGRPATVTELAATLTDEVTDRGRLLTEREREVLENHLVDEVASALQELILTAENQVLRMNQELESRPTSTGMRLRLRWIPGDDAPTGAAAALRQLRQTSDVWNDADRAAVGEFLQHEIDRVRTAGPAGTWLEHLTTAFDYRHWNRFVIELQQRGQWRSATGPASGGERVLAASVPLFAAASAHYSSGSPHAPRLVMLDEAFAGVDDNARAKYLGLLAAFDLDVVMTSEREWGCYPEVPGLAIAQLARTDDVAAVLVTPWEWDGHHRREALYASSTTDPEPTTAAAEGLF